MRKRGFNLIEVIASIGIFSVALVVILAIFPKSMRISRESREISVATQLAQEQIEDILSQSYDDILTGTLETRQKIDSNPNSQFYSYERETHVDYIDGNFQIASDDTGLKRILTTVFWQESSGEKNVQIVRIFNRR